MSRDDSAADYYHCDGCGHLWGVRRDNGTIVHYVTPFTKTEDMP